MQYRIFSYSIKDGVAEMEELNRFLQSHKIVELEKQLLANTNYPLWTFCVQYIENNSISSNSLFEKKERIDYKNVLDPKTFEKFSNLREIRKDLAQEDAVPVYAVFTNEELAELAKLEILDKQSMRRVKGIGEKKVEKYGLKMCEMFKNTLLDETSRESDF